MAKKTKAGPEKDAASSKGKKTTKKAAAGKTSKKKATAKKAASKKTASKKKVSKKKVTKETATKKAANKKKATKKKVTKKSAAKTKAPTKKSTKKKVAKTPARKASSAKKVTREKSSPAKAPASMTPADRALATPGRRGQVAAEKARFETGTHEPVLREGLGELPPGYDLSIVRAWIRDPRHIAIAWDINDPDMVATAEQVGWEAIGVRVIDEGGAIVSDLHVKKRSGIYHLELPAAGLSLRMALGLHREDGFFETLALSGPVRTPPEGPPADEGEYHSVRLDDDLDRRLLAEHEAPPRPGHRAPSALSPGARVRARLELAYRSAVGSVEDATLSARLQRALEAGEAAAEERSLPPGAASGSDPEGEGSVGPGRGENQALSPGGRARPGTHPSSAEQVGGPSSHGLPTSPSRPTSPGASRD